VAKLVDHFLEYVDPCGLKAMLVAVDRKACSLYKDAIDERLKKLGHPPEWSDVIISAGQNDPPELERFHYDKRKTDELIDYFKLTEGEWKAWNRDRYGDKFKERPPLKILIVCDRLLTGFNAPILQAMYLDKPLRDHNLLQAIARTNRKMPALSKRTGIIVDFFGVFRNLEKALNFDENIREEALIDWQALKDSVPTEVNRCLELFEGIVIEDTRTCLLGALRRLRDPDAARNFEHNFKSLEALWEAISPDPCLYPHRQAYRWLCGIYVAHRRRLAGEKASYQELAAKTRKLIEENLTFMSFAESSPVYKIDANYLTKLQDLPTPADKAAMLEAALTRELSEDEPGFIYRKLGERLKQLKQERDASDKAAAKRLREYEAMANQLNEARAEPERLGLPDPIDYGLFTVLREHAAACEETVLASAARAMIAHLRRNNLLPAGWSATRGGRMRVGQSLLAESWKPEYAPLGFDQDAPDPPFLSAAVDELAKYDH
jgi:type I restriction enzyme R subunit